MFHKNCNRWFKFGWDPCQLLKKNLICFAPWHFWYEILLLWVIEIQMKNRLVNDHNCNKHCKSITPNFEFLTRIDKLMLGLHSLSVTPHEQFKNHCWARQNRKFWWHCLYTSSCSAVSSSQCPRRGGHGLLHCQYCEAPINPRDRPTPAAEKWRPVSVSQVI